MRSQTGFSRGLEDFGRWIPQSEMRLHFNVLSAQISRNRLEINAILFHLLGVRELKSIVVSRRPTVSHMEEQQFRPVHLGQF